MVDISAWSNDYQTSFTHDYGSKFDLMLEWYLHGNETWNLLQKIRKDVDQTKISMKIALKSSMMVVISLLFCK